MNKLLVLDLGGTKSIACLHEQLKAAFGFPEFYGGNYPALVDCLTSLRFPQDGMSKIILDSPDDSLEIQVRGLTSCGDDVIRFFLSAIEATNQREIISGLTPSIILRLV